MTILNRLLHATAVIAILLFTSCSGCSGNWDNEGGQGTKTQSKQPVYENEAPVNHEVEVVDAVQDIALLVRLGRINGDSIEVQDEGTREKYTFSIAEAKSKGMIKGSLSAGNRYSVFPNNRNKSVEIAINVDELEGKWFYDMSQHRGLIFEEHGGLSSINAAGISFREWKLLNGKLYIYYVTEDMVATNHNEYLVEEADLRTLSSDVLVFTLKGETYQCKRQVEAAQFKMNN